MPSFTDTQRANIRLYLGWSARFHQTDSRLEQAMSAVDMESSGATNTICVALLASLADIEAKLLDAHNRLKAMQVGSITLPGKNELGLLRSEGRRFAGKLAATLGVEVRHDVFSGSGPREFASADGNVGGGNFYRHG